MPFVRKFRHLSDRFMSWQSQVVQTALRVSITISVVIVVSAVVAVGGYAIVGYLAGLATQPHPDLTVQGFSPGACQTDYTLWIFPTGSHTMVTANFTLRNTGLANGKVTITFTEDGAGVSPSQDFFIGAGKTALMSAQFRIDGCGLHQYGAYISNVQTA